MDFELTQEQKMVQKMARDLAEKHFKAKAFTWEKREEYPWENAKILAKNGMLGLRIPQEDGGGGGTLMDAVLAMEGEGPSHGEPRHLGKIIAGDNGAEVDVVLGAMLGLPTDKMRFFKTIEQEGLGKSRLEDINVMGVFELLKDFALPSINALSTEDLKLLFKHHGQLKPELSEDDCTLCGRCVEVCFAGALEMQDYPCIDYDKCIACWCCYEMCPEGAYTLPDAGRIVQQIRASNRQP